MLPDVTEHIRATSFADSIVRPLVKSLPLVCAGLTLLLFLSNQHRPTGKFGVVVGREVKQTNDAHATTCVSLSQGLFTLFTRSIWATLSNYNHPSKFTYSLHSTDLKTTDTAKYLGITISQDMKWTKHITQTSSRANRALGFIRRNIKVRSPRIKEKLYNSLVRPHVEYASAVWSPMR